MPWVQELRWTGPQGAADRVAPREQGQSLPLLLLVLVLAPQILMLLRRRQRWLEGLLGSVLLVLLVLLS